MPRGGCEKELDLTTNQDLGRNSEKYRLIETKGVEMAIKEAVNIITFCKAVGMRVRTISTLGNDKFLCTLGKTVLYQGVTK